MTSETMDKAATASDAVVWRWLILAWSLATAASLGSLFFSEIMELPPCSLCWYQRVFMFPLALVLLVGVVTSDKLCVRYALPLAVVGWLVAAYHVLLQIGVIPHSAAPCQAGVSCTDVQYELFGFASIPALSLGAFSALVGLLVLARLSVQRTSKNADSSPGMSQ